MDITEISETQWVKHWAGNWSLLSCSYFGEQYTQTLWEELGTGMKNALLVYGNGHSACYYPKSELDAFGANLAWKAQKDEKYIQWLAEELVKRAGRILKLMDRLRKRGVREREYAEFEKELYKYVSPHVAVKKIVDYLPPTLLKKYISKLEKARVYAEKVYTETEEIMQEFAAGVSEKEKGLTPELVLCLTKEELGGYFESGKLPGKKTLEERFNASALVFTNGEAQLFSGKEALEIEKALRAYSSSSEEARGSSAYPGVVRGIARIVLRPERGVNFKEGEILITSMTRPDFMPLIRKAAAIVTDGGGILSHAAIVARELKKPTVIGTQDATKKFKDGDYIEVDAERES